MQIATAVADFKCHAIGFSQWWGQSQYEHIIIKYCDIQKRWIYCCTGETESLFNLFSKGKIIITDQHLRAFNEYQPSGALKELTAVSVSTKMQVRCSDLTHVMMQWCLSWFPVLRGFSHVLTLFITSVVVPHCLIDKKVMGEQKWCWHSHHSLHSHRNIALRLPWSPDLKNNYQSPATCSYVTINNSW